MKRLLATVLLMLVAVPLHSALRLKKPAQRQAHMKVATMVPKGTSFHVALQQMGEAWKNAPGGGVTLTVYPDGTMGSEADIVRRMRMGQLDGALLSVPGLAEIDRDVTALQLMPMMFRDLAEVEYVRDRMQPVFARRMREKGFVVLFWADAGWVRFFARKPAVTPDDLRKLKLFTVADDNGQVDLMKRLGYKPVPLEFSDALTSLKTGMIDAVPCPPFYALAGQFDTVAGHMIEVNWVPLVGALVMTSKSWDALPPAARESMQQSAAAAGTSIQASGRAESDAAVNAMRKRGLVVHRLTPQAKREWEQTAATAYPYIRGGLVPADVFDDVQNLLTERRKNGSQKVGGRP